MELKELRIGNWVNLQRANGLLECKKVFSIQPEFVSLESVNANPCEKHFIFPIKLTNEILKKIGFKSSSDKELYFSIENTDVCFVIQFFGDQLYYSGGEGKKLSVPLLYVHQLQNLFFSVKGVELKISEL